MFGFPTFSELYFTISPVPIFSTPFFFSLPLSQNDAQAQARAHRIGQKQQVIVLRLVTNQSIEEQILATALHKLDVEAKIIRGGMFTHQYDESTHHERLNEMVRDKDASGGGGADGSADGDGGGDQEEGESVDFVCQAISRNAAELAMFVQMEKERVAALGNVRPTSLRFRSLWSALMHFTNF